MSRRKWAPGGKLTADEVAAVRQGNDAAAGGKVSARQLERIRSGASWPQGWRPPAIDTTERRLCPMCGVMFSRRYASGRSRSDAQWARKKTCSNACNIKMRWVAGCYERKGPKIS